MLRVECCVLCVVLVWLFGLWWLWRENKCQLFGALIVQSLRAKLVPGHPGVLLPATLALPEPSITHSCEWLER